MRFRKFTLGLCSISLLLILSCDPYGGYEYRIDNKSDSPVFVVVQEVYDNKIVSIEIQPKSDTLIGKYESINGLHDYGSDFLKRYFDSLNIMIDTTSRLTIKKDFSKRDSWIYNQKKTGQLGLKKTGDNIYTFEINNEDLK